jgi:hypothetical protein
MQSQKWNFVPTLAIAGHTTRKPLQRLYRILADTTLRSLHDVHKINKYIRLLCLPMFQFESQWMDFDQVWYEHDAIGA